MQFIRRVRRIYGVPSPSVPSASQKPTFFSTFKKSPTRSRPSPTENPRKESKKTLDVLFKEAVGLIPESEGNVEEDVSGTGVKDLDKGLMELEEELKELTRKHPVAGRVESSGGREGEKREGGGSKGKSLSEVFAVRDCREGEGDELVVEDFSQDMEMFLRHLYDEGYFKDVNFLRGKGFDISCFEDRYARSYLMFAAERFGRDNQEIAKWLSGRNLKAIALFGCPSLSRRNIFAAKELRTFFQIPENTVCCMCSLRERCKFKNQRVWTKNSDKLNLPLIMRLLTVYAMEAVSPKLVLSGEIKACASSLITESIKLSKTKS